MSTPMKSSLIVITGTSGAGKSTLINLLIRDPSISLSISYTTRSPRPKEANLKDYFFISRKEFKKRIDANEFYEWTEYDGNFYGTAYSELNKNKIVLIDVEREGSLKFNEFKVCKIFLYQKKEVLEQRLLKRFNDDQSKVNDRLKTYEDDIKNSESGIFDHKILTSDLNANYIELKRIIFDFANKQ